MGILADNRDFPGLPARYIFERGDMTDQGKPTSVQIWPDVLELLDEAARRVGVSRETAVNTMVMAALQYDVDEIRDVLRVKS